MWGSQKGVCVAGASRGCMWEVRVRRWACCERVLGGGGCKV